MKCIAFYRECLVGGGGAGEQFREDVPLHGRDFPQDFPAIALFGEKVGADNGNLFCPGHVHAFLKGVGEQLVVRVEKGDPFPRGGPDPRVSGGLFCVCRRGSPGKIWTGNGRG